MSIQVEEVAVSGLKAHPKNAKKHTPKQIDVIVASMGSTGGSIVPIVIDENNVILAGHGRFEAHKKRGDDTAPCVRKTGLSEEDKLRFLLADNQSNAMTGNDKDVVGMILQELREKEVDISRIGFTEGDIDKFLQMDADDDRDYMEEASEESLGLRELKDRLTLTVQGCTEKWQLPQLLEQNFVQTVPDEFVMWMNRHRTPALAKGQMYLHTFGRESTKGLDPLETIIGFYIDDSRFERVWTKLKENTQRFINAGVYGLIMPDFTRVEGFPLPTNMWSVYRNFYCALYWQMAGLDIIPNLQGFDVDSVEAVCEPIPQHCPVVAVQLQTIQHGNKQLRSAQGATGLSEEAHQELLNLQLDLLKPETLLVYGSERGLTLAEGICKNHGVRIATAPNRATAALSMSDEAGF